MYEPHYPDAPHTAFLAAPVAGAIGVGVIIYAVLDLTFDLGGALDKKYGQFNVNIFER